MDNAGRSTIKRVPKRAVYDRDKIYRLLDNEFLCHVGFIYKGLPVVIPTMYGRKDDSIYIHGAAVSRLITETEKEIDVSISIANVSGLVLARSAFHHSLNYESVVIFGKGQRVGDTDKTKALKIISDHLVKHRWEEVRKPNEKELKATKVVRIEIVECSAKVRSGGPIDDKKDYDLNIWAGVLPITKSYGAPVPDPVLKENLKMPKSIVRLRAHRDAGQS